MPYKEKRITPGGTQHHYLIRSQSLPDPLCRCCSAIPTLYDQSDRKYATPAWAPSMPCDVGEWVCGETSATAIDPMGRWNAAVHAPASAGPSKARVSAQWFEAANNGRSPSPTPEATTLPQPQRPQRPANYMILWRRHTRNQQNWHSRASGAPKVAAFSIVTALRTPPTRFSGPPWRLRRSSKMLVL